MNNRTTPEREYLLKAFNSFRVVRPQFWGDDLDTALAQPSKCLAIVQVARHMQAGTTSSTGDTLRRPAISPRTIRHLPTGTLDFKSLAAGEKADREED